MLASKSIGFGWSCRIIGFFSLVCLVTANFSIKTRLPPKASLGGSETKEPFLKRLAALLKDKAYMCAVMGVFLMVLGILFPVFFIQTVRSRYRILERLLTIYLALCSSL